MQIKEAIIGQFGKLQNRNISFEPGINVIYGENAQGKTNLLEALAYLSCGKGAWKRHVKQHVPKA